MAVNSDRFGFLLLPKFPHAAFASAVDALALANYVSDSTLFEWHTIGESDADVVAQNGLATKIDHRTADAPQFDTIAVCGGIDGSRITSSALQGWLRAQYSTGATVGAISTGSWILARAGLLDGKRCTVHWEDLDAFRETFPAIHTTSEIFEIDARIFTCSGGSASVDLFLSFIAIRHGMTLAASVAEQLVHGPVRSDREKQRFQLRDRTGITSPVLTQATELMEANIEQPLTQDFLAQKLGVSGRQVERLFRKHLGQTPRGYYRDLRLSRARSLLRATNMSVLQIAYATGFCTSSHLSKCFRAKYGHLPSEERGDHLPVRIPTETEAPS